MTPHSAARKIHIREDENSVDLLKTKFPNVSEILIWSSHPDFEPTCNYIAEVSRVFPQLTKLKSWYYGEIDSETLITICGSLTQLEQLHFVGGFLDFDDCMLIAQHAPPSLRSFGLEIYQAEFKMKESYKNLCKVFCTDANNLPNLRQLYLYTNITEDDNQGYPAFVIKMACHRPEIEVTKTYGL